MPKNDTGTDVVLALGCGSARGLAHIGAIRELERAGYNIRGVAGSSIGAVIGALYCAGALGEYEKYVLSLNWKSVLRMLDPVFPTAGLLGGDHLKKMIAQFIGERDIEDLDIPFCAVASDLATGEEVRLRKGPVEQMVRASFAVPGIFTPVEWQGEYLVDGGVSSPVPVGAARELADAELPVIAIDVNAGPRRTRTPGKVIPPSKPPPSSGYFDAFLKPFGAKQESGPGLFSSLSDCVAHVQHRLTVLQLERDIPDYLIETDLGSVGMFDYHRAEGLIRAGRRAAKRALRTGRRRRGRLKPMIRRWLPAWALDAITE
ncbi:MAG: patatin-like phospholipase family protein [Elusimicrobiota bacterium]